VKSNMLQTMSTMRLIPVIGVQGPDIDHRDGCNVRCLALEHSRVKTSLLYGYASKKSPIYSNCISVPMCATHCSCHFDDSDSCIIKGLVRPIIPLILTA
jgi:hypothetical protein